MTYYNKDLSEDLKAMKRNIPGGLIPSDISKLRSQDGYYYIRVRTNKYSYATKSQMDRDFKSLKEEVKRGQRLKGR